MNKLPTDLDTAVNAYETERAYMKGDHPNLNPDDVVGCAISALPAAGYNFDAELRGEPAAQARIRSTMTRMAVEERSPRDILEYAIQEFKKIRDARKRAISAELAKLK